MSFLLTCPNCGTREVTDFGYGGEISARPSARPSLRQLGEYNYFRRNVAGVQREWWFHRSGCRAWFIAERDTVTNEVLRIELPGEGGGRGGVAVRRGRRGMSRLPQQPGERIDRQKVVRFTFDGKAVEAFEGDTIGSALYAAGRRTFSRSFKYHRRRGLLCCAGQCPNCIVAVDGAPGVRACVEPVTEGMRVEHLNATPGLELDVMRATDLVGTKFTPPGFYYKTFIRPRRLWPLYEKVLRHAAGLGVLRKEQADREWRTEYRRRHADVLVVGGGIAGVSAAQAAAAAGRRRGAGRRGPRSSRSPASRSLARATALGYFDGMVPVWQGDTLHQIRARSHVFATGDDRAAAGVRRQRPPRGHALGRRAAPARPLRGQPRHARGGRDDQ